MKKRMVSTDRTVFICMYVCVFILQLFNLTFDCPICSLQMPTTAINQPMQVLKEVVSEVEEAEVRWEPVFVHLPT